MNSFWNKNFDLFTARFPALQKQLSEISDISREKEPESPYWQVLQSKSGDLTVKEKGIFLHSAYAPQKEAENTVRNAKKENTDCAVFFSIGLGYAPLEWAKKYPEDTIILVEPELSRFFAALKFTDFFPLFQHKKLILLLNAAPKDVITLTEHSAKLSHTAILENKAQTRHAEDYFSALHALFERNIQKEKINSATLEKFSKLWLRNSCKNLNFLEKLDGINVYKDACPKGLPFLLISAGPGLTEILPHLKELKERCITVAVDTALRACLKVQVEPDFIVLTDPQYYAYRHIAGLKSQTSVLITESAVCPPVFRFKCRKTVLCSSLFPLGQYFEKKLGEKGTLGTGGSVSTTAWDFCRLAGAEEIFCAGLDLAYPKKQGHIRGSFFEEAAHAKSTRLDSAEKKLSSALFAANPEKALDYEKKEVVTDSKMKMFAWWFESQTQKYPEISCFSLSRSSLAVPGFKTADVHSLLNRPKSQKLRKAFFEAEQKNAKTQDIQNLLSQNYNSALSELKEGLENLFILSKSAISICENLLSDKTPQSEKIQTALKQLEQIDLRLRNSQFTQIVSLVFPTESQLDRVFSSCSLPQEPQKQVFARSKAVYQELAKSITQYQKYLPPLP